MAEAQATPKQIAYLEFLGVHNARTLTKFLAGREIEALHEASDSDPSGELAKRCYAWRTVRFRLHPDLYRADAFEFVMLSEDSFRSHVRGRIVGASGKLTKAKVETVVRVLLDEDPLWWEGPDANERFFAGLAAAFPDCVDGTTPAREEKKVELKPLPPIVRSQRSFRIPVVRPGKEKKRGGCGGMLAGFLVLAAVVAVVALG